jgi:hypothetical protein
MTLNQIVKRIKAIAEAHEQINTFVFGDIDDALRLDVVYPACFMPYPSETISSVDDTMAASLFFMDRTVQGGSETDKTYNELEVTSDMREVAKDIFAQLLYQKYNPIWNVSKDCTITLTNESELDYLAGAQLSFTIKLPYIADRCAVPTNYNYGS